MTVFGYASFSVLLYFTLKQFELIRSNALHTLIRSRMFTKTYETNLNGHARWLCNRNYFRWNFNVHIQIWLWVCVFFLSFTLIFVGQCFQCVLLCECALRVFMHLHVQLASQFIQIFYLKYHTRALEGLKNSNFFYENNAFAILEKAVSGLRSVIWMVWIMECDATPHMRTENSVLCYLTAFVLSLSPSILYYGTSLIRHLTNDIETNFSASSKLMHFESHAI